jgi:hypothetical protein
VPPKPQQRNYQLQLPFNDDETDEIDAQMTTCINVGKCDTHVGAVPLYRLLSSVHHFSSLLMAFLFLSSMAAKHVEAQGASPTKPPSISIEGRIDAIAASTSAIQAGVGLTTVAGIYVRTGVVGAIGASKNGLSGRADAFARFHLDPFRESRWAPYGGAGLSTRMEQGERTRAYLLVFAGIDGPIRDGLTTSIEAGLGGGGRIGIILRRAVARQR